MNKYFWCYIKNPVFSFKIPGRPGFYYPFYQHSWLARNPMHMIALGVSSLHEPTQKFSSGKKSHYVFNKQALSGILCNVENHSMYSFLPTYIFYKHNHHCCVFRIHLQLIYKPSVIYITEVLVTLRYATKQA